MIETQKIFKPEEKIMVVCDYREKEVIEHLKKLDVIVNEKTLEVGDFVCSKRVCVERKSHSDFIGSIINGRMFEQASNLKDNFERPIVIIEGYSNRQINENALKGAIASLILDFGISLVTTRNPFDTAKDIFWLAKREQSEKKANVGIKVGKKPKDIKKLQEFIVAGIPSVSLTIARRLLERFGSIEEIFAADETELRKVKGIGENLAKKIRKIMTIRY
ncbi:MAG TPA: ERCC4 domain-containing protein [archaeon]|nr:ERCC4 domain-containing protein [archaeon]